MKTPIHAVTIADEAIHYGVSWYPEMWPETEWSADVARMREVGFNLVRLFEFAWKRFEPSEGVFEFDWALRVMDELHAAGIKVMIGTPTAAPPAWLTSRYPEVLGTHSDGRRKTHGKRKHYNHHSAKYREFARRIVTRMVEVLGDHPAVHSWQIDNEMSGFDYGDETRAAFHRWLEQRYGSVERLNALWGLDFWSQAYDSFEQVPLCTAEVGSIAIPERHHPSLIMAIARFQNEAWTAFIDEQARIIRSRCLHPVSTNMTGTIGQMDWFRHFRTLDRAGVSMYADLSYYHYNYIRFDRLRAEKRAPFWLLETAPNWSGGGPIWNIHHDERGIRAFTWMSMLMGGSMALYWQWRSHWAGQEMQHGTCVSQTGKWMPGKAAWQRMAAEFAGEPGEFLRIHHTRRGPIAIMADCENSWLFSIDPVHPENRYDERLRDDYHLPLVRAHLHRDVIHPEADYSPYAMLICPHLSILSEETKLRLRGWVESGGVLLLGPFSGTRTVEMTAWTDREFGGLEELMGADSAMRFTPHWVEQEIDVVFGNGRSCHPRIWCEAFAPHASTDVLAHYRGGYGDGLPAVISRGFGRGRVVSIGTALDETCYITLVKELAASIGIRPIASGGEGVLCCPRVNAEGIHVATGVVNTRKEPRSITLEMGGRDLLSGESCPATIELQPLEVRLIVHTD